MRRILLDENLPVALKLLLVGLDVKTVQEMGWIGVANGDLLVVAETANFEVLLTADRNLRYQQNMAGRRIALVILSTSHWPTVKAGIERVLEAVIGVSDSAYREVTLERPKLSRKPPPSGKP